MCDTVCDTVCVCVFAKQASLYAFTDSSFESIVFLGRADVCVLHLPQEHFSLVALKC